MSRKYEYEPYQMEILCQHKKTVGYQTFPYHRHNGYEIYLFLQGNIHLYIEQNCYLLGAGDLVLISPSVMHRIVSLDNQVYERITINIKQSVFDRLSTSNTDLSACFSVSEKHLPPIRLDEGQVSEFVTYANHLSDSLCSGGYGADVCANIRVSQILLLANRCLEASHFQRPNIMPDLVKDVMLYIRENLTENLSLDHISGIFYHNGSYISHLFKKHTGLSLREYILDRRIECAKQFLASGSNVSEACYESGFSDYSNFIRSFTKVAGISPGRYRKARLYTPLPGKEKADS